MMLRLCITQLQFFLSKMLLRLDFNGSIQPLKWTLHSTNLKYYLHYQICTVSHNFSISINKFQFQIEIPFFVYHFWKLWRKLQRVFIFFRSKKLLAKAEALFKCGGGKLVKFLLIFILVIKKFKLLFCLNGTFLKILGTTI